jgi:quercetin dioxygenase-like cupin family protein
MLNRKKSLSENNGLTRLAAAALVAVLAVPLAALADEAAIDRAMVRATDSPDLEWGPCPAFMPEGCGLAVLHGNPAEPNADVLFKLPAGRTAPPHWHTSAERMVLLSGEMKVEYEGQEAEVVEAGDYAYGPPRVSHWATCTSEEDCVLFIAFVEPVDAVPTAD